MDSSIRALAGVDAYRTSLGFDGTGATIAGGIGATSTGGIGATSTGGIGATSTDGIASAASSAFGLSTDEFFQLFLAQLKNQDPTQPVDDKEMVSQMAQFTMIQTLQEVSASLQGSRLAQAAGLIGKQVTGYDEQGNVVTGNVDRVDQTADGFWIVVGDARIAPKSVATVTVAADPAAAGG